MSADHFALAREYAIPHGEAVVLARSFCPSGSGKGPHGSICPCDDCTERAVVILADLVKRGRLTFTPIERFMARGGAGGRD